MTDQDSLESAKSIQQTKSGGMLRSTTNIDSIEPQSNFEVELSEQIKLDNPNDDVLFLTNIRTSQQNPVDRSKYIGKDFKLRDKPSSFCMANRILLLKTKGKYLHNAISKPQGCNSWSCPVCSPKKAFRVRNTLIEVIMLNSLKYFLTLTLDPRKIPINHEYDTHKYITAIFNHFSTKLRRYKGEYYDKRKKKWIQIDIPKSKEKLKYVWVIEFQKNGNAHMHVMLNLFLPIELVRDIWTHVGGGIQMRIEEARNIEATAVYVAKYLSKSLNSKKSGFKYFQKRYAISQSCERTVLNSKPLIKQHFNDVRVSKNILDNNGLQVLAPYFFDTGKNKYTLNFKIKQNETKIPTVL